MKLSQIAFSILTLCYFSLLRYKNDTEQEYKLAVNKMNQPFLKLNV